MSTDAVAARRKRLVKLGLAALAALALVALLAAGVDVRGLIARGLEVIRGAGPLAFFTAMAVLPAAGVPFLAFMLPAVPVFGPQLGIPAVVACGLLATVVNMGLSYVLARWTLRPLIERLVVALGFRLPQVDAGDQTDLIVILRVTPGMPFFVQNYVLGLANVPFRKFALLSGLITLPTVTAIMLFSDALLQGKGKVIFVTVMALVALTAATHLVRRHYERKKAS